MNNRSPRKKETKLKKKKVPNKVFMNMLKNARVSCGMTQAQLAEKLGFSCTGTVSQWEQGRAFPEIETLLKLPDVLHCDLDYLIGRIHEQTHDMQLIHDRTGLSTKTIKLLIFSKEQSEWYNNPDNQKEPKGITFGDYPAYLFYKRLSLGEMISKIIEDKHADEMMDNVEKLVFTDRFYAYWMRHAHTDPSWVAESPDEEYNPEDPSITIGFETITEKSYFDLIQYRTTMLFQKILEDITERKESFTLEEIKKFVPNVKDDTEAREILRYLELHRQARKNKKRKEV